MVCNIVPARFVVPGQYLIYALRTTDGPYIRLALSSLPRLEVFPKVQRKFPCRYASWKDPRHALTWTPLTTCNNDDVTAPIPGIGV